MTASQHLEGKVVVVTGAGRGLGRATAQLLASNGAAVVVADYGGAVDVRARGTSEAADQVVAEIVAGGGRAVACAEDVATLEGGQRIVKAAVESYGRLDGLVCFAGVMVQKYLWEMEERDWDDVMAVHLKGHFSCRASCGACDAATTFRSTGLRVERFVGRHREPTELLCGQSWDSRFQLELRRGSRPLRHHHELRDAQRRDSHVRQDIQ